MLIDDELQHMFRVAHFLHPDRETAYEVTRDGIKKGEMKLAGQNRRPPTSRPNKQSLSLKNAALSGIFAASEILEKDQESRVPLIKLQYELTNEDFLLRYIKKLVWHSMERDSEWVSIAIGHFLYCYPLNHIARLSPEFFDDQNMWRTRGYLGDMLQARFQWDETRYVASGRTIPVIERRATDAEFDSVQAFLTALAPFVDDHPKSCLGSENLVETYLFPESIRTEAERIHALMNPECGGWVRIVEEFNKYQSTCSEGPLPAARDQMRIPTCPYGVYTSGQSGSSDAIEIALASRFSPEPLSGIELNSLKRKATDSEPFIELDHNVG